MLKTASHLFKQIKTFISVTVFVQLLFCSCATTYKPSYFMDLSPTADTVINGAAPYNVPRIKYGDILSLSVIPLDQLSNLYQAPVSGSVSYSTQGSTVAPSTAGTGFTVDKNGMIEAPLIGPIKLINLTIDDAKQTLREKYALFYKNFTINVAFLNHKITVLGEVGKPGSFNIQTDHITIFDALGLAGDITVFGKKDNVILVRDSTDNKKHLVRLDLNSENIFKSPYYYLKENDLLYVEPGRSKLASTDTYRTRNLAIFTTTLSFILVVLFRTKVL